MNAIAARKLAEDFLDAIESHDYERLRGLLAEDDFEYESPISRFSSTDDFIQQISLMGGIVHRIERRRLFVDGKEICLILVFVTQLSDKESLNVVLWMRVSEGRIQRIEALFDTHWYHRMFEPGD